jgi:hypothetical protein
MQIASAPPLWTYVWDYSGANLRAIPQTTTTFGEASMQKGWPQETFTPISSGGIQPDGRDDNGILNAITTALQWLNAGAPPFYSAAFSAANGGYPKWAMLANAATPGLFWISTTDNNVTDPDTGGAGWVGFPTFQTAATAADVQAGLSGANAATRVVTPGALAGACAYQTLTDAATIAWNAALGYNAEVTMTSGVGSSRALGAPTNLNDGQTYVSDLIQGASGGPFTISAYASIFDFGSAAAPTLSTGAGKRDKLIWQYRSTTGKMHYIGATLGL